MPEEVAVWSTIHMGNVVECLTGRYNTGVRGRVIKIFDPWGNLTRDTQPRSGDAIIGIEVTFVPPHLTGVTAARIGRTKQFYARALKPCVLSSHDNW